MHPYQFIKSIKSRSDYKKNQQFTFEKDKK